MFSTKLIAFLLSMRALLMPCCPQAVPDYAGNHKPRAYARMSDVLRESSGLEMASGGSFWTIRDSGADAVVYRIDANGHLLDTLLLPLPNRDWEALAQDSENRLYIGDFGNNLNQRKDLRIYKLGKDRLKIDTIRFFFKDQKAIPPPKKLRNYDCEAFLWMNGSLHLFSKSRGDGYVRHYAIPDQPGTYAALAQDSAYVRGEVTAADISPDEKTIALLTYGKVYLFAVDSGQYLLRKPLACIRIPWAGQSEAIVFVNNKSLLIGNERGRLFYLQLNK